MRDDVVNQTASPRPRSRPLAEVLTSIFIITLMLYFGASIFVPVILAVLLAFALTPLVKWFGRHLHLPDPVAVLLAVAIAVAGLASFAYLAGTQILQLAAAIPEYQATISTKLAALQAQFGGGVFEQIANSISNFGTQLGGASPAVDGSVETSAPTRVTIENPMGPVGMLTSVMGSVVGPIATSAIVLVFLVFVLMSRADLYDRFIRLVSGGRFLRTNIAISDASKRVGRYLLTQLCVNIGYGFAFGVGLWLIGVPSAPLWGLMVVLFRYIPFVGALLVAIAPFFLAFAVDPGWNLLIMTVALFVVIDLTTANVIEPRLYGSSTGVSVIAILLSAMFWGTLWGPIGLILATPMTVCLVVIGRHLPRLHFLEMLLGTEPVLTPSERLYQRMLRGNVEEAVEFSEEFVAENGRQDFYDKLALPALVLATNELAEGNEALAQRRQTVETFDAIIDEISDITWPAQSDIVLIGAGTEIDECVATLVALALADRGVESRVLPPAAVRQDSIGRIDLTGADVVMLVFAQLDFRAQARYIARRLRRVQPSLRILVCGVNPAASHFDEDMLRVDEVYRSIGQAAAGAVANLRHQLSKADHVSQANPFAGAGRGEGALAEALQQLMVDFSMPIAVINLLDDEHHIEDESAFSLTQHVVEANRTLVIQPGLPVPPEIGENAYLQTNGIDVYAATPLRLSDGRCVGTLTVIDYEPRAFTDEDVARLEAASALLSARFGQVPADVPVPDAPAPTALSL